MKWGLVGYGSIGRRHADNLVLLSDEVVVVTNNQSCSLLKVNSIFELINIHKPDAIIISNETSLHEKSYREIRALLPEVPILIEKPIFDKRYDFTSDVNSYVAYCLRFHPLVMEVKKTLGKSKVISASFYVGQHLTTWRKERDYRSTYSAKKELGGGVLRDLSHEIDLASYLLGDVELGFCKSGHISNLEITSDDYFIGLFTSKAGVNITIEMNYFDRITQRNFTIHTNETTIRVDFVKSEIVTNQSVEIINFDKNQMYINMLKSMKDKDYREFASFEDGMKVLDIISQAEKT